MADKPDIFIERHAWDQITAAVHHQDLEVMFFGRGTYAADMAEPDPRGHYILHEIIVPPQEVSGVFTDTGEEKQNTDALNFIISEAVRLGRPISGWGFWGHSHVDMGTSPSSTDKETMLSLAPQWSGRSIGAVFNQKGDITAWGAGPHPLFKGMLVNMNSLEVKVDLPAAPKELLDQVIDWMKGVTRKTYVNALGLGSGTYSQRFTTSVTETINSNLEPTTVFLSASDWETITGLPHFDGYSEQAWTKYEDKGWAALTPFERKLILPAMDTQSLAKEKATTSHQPYEEWAALYGFDED